MGADTKIEWAHHSWNPWVGCTKVSPACDRCYAEAWAKRTGHPELWAGERRRTSASYWQQPHRWNRLAAEAGDRHRVFCASLADVFDNQVYDRWRDDLWHLISQTPALDWLLLTKRPQNIAKMLPGPKIGAPEWGAGWPNVWLGTTAENQDETDRRGVALGAVPAAKRFFSCEPLLGSIEIHPLVMLKLDLVIAGGESGPGARPMHPDWARSLRDQCQAASCAFFMKQWGEHWPAELVEIGPDGEVWRTSPDGVNRWSLTEGAPALQTTPIEPVVFERVGKKAAGRLLDGRTWDEMPR